MHAHVDADAGADSSGADSSVQPNGDATIQFSFDHGCAGEPTTSLRVQIPDGVTDVVPAPVDGWQTAVTATEFSWTGGSIPDSQPAVFAASMRVSGQAGTTIWFPTVQGCPTAEEAWIATPAPGEPEPANPAPSIELPFTISAPSTEAPATSTTRTTLVPGEAAITQEGSPRDNTGLIVLLVAVAAIVVAAVALYLRYRGRGNTTS
jgi:uncharacterized protein YcnI